MPKVITYGGDVRIGAFKFPDRKKPYIGIEKGNECRVYGHFLNDEAANNFMDELGKFLGAKFEEEDK